jgi:fibronectin-binding autotransporter adhesin
MAPDQGLARRNQLLGMTMLARALAAPALLSCALAVSTAKAGEGRGGNGGANGGFDIDSFYYFNRVGAPSDTSTGTGGSGGAGGGRGKGGWKHGRVGIGGLPGMPAFDGSVSPPSGFSAAPGGAGAPGENGDDGSGRLVASRDGRNGGGGGGGGGGGPAVVLRGTAAHSIGASLENKGGDGGAGGRGGDGGDGNVASIFLLFGTLEILGDGGDGGGGAGGGGGGAGLSLVDGGSVSLLGDNRLTGGNGGDGGDGGRGGSGQGPSSKRVDGGGGHGGDGGEGGVGLSLSRGSASIGAGSVIRGGNGGRGGKGGDSGPGNTSDVALGDSGLDSAISGAQRYEPPAAKTGGDGSKGGDGGHGVTIRNGATLTTAPGVSIIGGNGGDGGQNGIKWRSTFGSVRRHANGGSGGSGGNGVVADQSGATIVNATGATIVGGDAGAGGELQGSKSRNRGYPGRAGRGGAGIVATGGNVAIINSGAIRGGRDPYVWLGAAIIFAGSGNSLELRAGSTIDGQVLGGGNAALILGGASDASFDLRELGEQYVGFSDFNKTGTSSWTLSGAPTAFSGSMAIEGGTLAFSAGTQLTAADARIANGTGSVATVTVTGAKATWTVDGRIDVGNQGQGSLAVASRGTVRADTIGVGTGTGGSGTISVAGAGSQVVARELVLGETSTGSAVVSGAGSSLTATTFTVGNSGSGTLTVADRGRAGAGRGRRIEVARNAGSTGTINIGAAAGQTAVAAGALDGDIHFGAGTGRLVFNHTDSGYSFSNMISGAGAIAFLAGTTILTGDSSGFSGTTTVSSSTLRLADTARLGGSLSIDNAGRVEGEGSIGATTINGGGTLAPSGRTSLTVNGNLTANAGGTIRPSDAAALVVNGTLTLNSGSNYDYKLHGYGGSSPGSATTRVNGDLVLNGGTLNLASSSQPAIGYHRVITYSGSLSGSGLVIGNTPVTSPVNYIYTPDTSLAGKVDVVVTPNGLNILQLWGTSPAGGGDGTWNAGNPNWFNLGGSTATQWGGVYGVFRGPGGTVTIDGSQNVVGLQFAGGSYTLVGGAGGSLNLHGYNNGGIVVTTPEIRVLDGETATIAAIITGSDGLEKTGDGTLILGGTNTYSGGTIISGGTLQISADGNLGAASGGLTFDSGALHTTADIVSARAVTLRDTGAIDTDAGTTLTLTNTVAGAGGLIKWGDGTLLLTGTNSWSGGTLVSAGTLRAGSAGALPTMTDWVLTGGRLDLNGYDLSMRLLAGSGGEIALGSADLTVDQTEDSLYAGTITGSGRLLKEGAGTLLLTGTSSYAGGTVIRDGTLAIVADANLGAAGSAIAFDGGGRLATYADITSGRSVTLSGSGTIETYAGTSLILGGAISGSGSLVKEGWGTLTLTGSASHGGGTVIAAGMLQIGNGGTTGDLSGNVVNDAVLSFNRSNDYSFSGVISGSGVVVQSGTGTTVLTGNNAYAGGTLIRAGALQVANDGNLGASGTAITFLGGALRFGASFSTDRTVLLIGSATVDTNGHDGTLTGGVYGYGDLTKTGAGTLRLTGTNYYRNTIVEAGTLIGDAASISGNVTANGTVVFDQRDDASIAGVFSGTGRFSKAGGGTLELTGDSSGFAGSTAIAAGTLVVNGALGGTLEVESGARLQGSGTVGATTVRSGATIAPGNSIGTLTVAGDITFERGATYEVEVSPGGTTSDLISASGKARLTGGSVLHLGEDGTYWANQRYTILTASQGVEGRFDDVSSRYLFLDPSLDYSADSVTLTLLRNDLAFATLAQTRNQAQTALGLESLSEANPLWLSFTQLRDESEARQAYDSLSGEIHASAKTALIEGSQMMRGAVSDRIRAAFDGIGAPRIATLAYASSKGAISAAPAESFALWARGFGSWGQTRGDGNAASLTRSSNGFTAGLDIAAAQDARIGITAGYSRSTFEVARRMSRGEADNYHLGLYGGARFDRFRLTGAVSYAWHELSTRRSVSFPGFGEQLSSRHDARSIQAFGEIAYRVDLGPAAFEPFANLAYVNLRSSAFAETGGVAALFARAQTTAVAFATLGLRAQIRFDLGSLPARFDTTLGWRRAAGDITPLSLQSFSGGSPFAIAGVPIARDALVVGAGFSLTVAPGAELALSYDGQLARRAKDHILNARLAMRF